MRAKKLLTSRQIFRYAVPARTVTKKALVYSEDNLTRFSASKTATVRNSLLDAKKNLSIARPVIPLATC